ncbi:hypothetical protein K505DRAFT_322473 [Melanomma pulvis-pyrius CBS 109.77]|uniref:Uncharacterized protein n=1 Tax=Melanomma pulvis-pyrius CBS 109.77 TaxID=1314802 RepID=A0A6A6XMK9_9PLEO|nr:hypothetical protein K505DRAFT_322473 [Melanomma pulvis-pyrius CBS 109.77]
MATHHGPFHEADDPAAATSDALSLHTIAEQADDFATQEQEDTDLALALALEDEESQAFLVRQGQPQDDMGDDAARNVHQQANASVSYRDDPENEEHLGSDFGALPPYRDDPSTTPSDGEEYIDAEVAPTSSQRRRQLWIYTPHAKKLIGSIVVLVCIGAGIIGIILVVLHRIDKSPSPKEKAWRASHSNDGDLRLPRLYPALEKGASEDCRSTWEKYAWTLNCHRMILSPALDNGDVNEVKEERADPHAYTEGVCTDQCQKSIRRLDTPMRNGCNRRTDRFEMGNYGKDGNAYFDKHRVDEGPVHVARSLMERYDSLCARPPKSQGDTCTAELWMRWGIVNGKNVRQMNGLDEFLNKTAEEDAPEGNRETKASVKVNGKSKSNIMVSSRTAGPKVGATNCGFCTLNWLERKMRSFEYGEMIDPESGNELGLKDFSDKMKNAMERCETYEARKAVQRVHWKWMKYGWWCDRELCHPDRKSTTAARTLLHGVREVDFPLPDIRKLLNERNSPITALQGLHDGMLRAPCSIWFTEQDAISDIIPYQHRIHHLCSDRCRNAVDRIQQQYGPDFGGVTEIWDSARARMNKTCLGPAYNDISRESTSFCAPGYAALRHPEWIFADSPPSKPEILSAFAAAIDDLDKRLPHYIPRPSDDPESQRILSRVVSESVCNQCAGELLTGRNPHWKDRIEEFLNDGSIDGREYTRVTKKYWVTCTHIIGLDLSIQQKKKLWKEIGLDRYD